MNSLLNKWNVKSLFFIRTTCTQNAETHLLYNWVVMDRAHNRRIVQKQAQDLGVDVNSRHPDYLYFV